MFKKIFITVLIVHLLAFAYFAFKPSPRADDADVPNLDSLPLDDPEAPPSSASATAAPDATEFMLPLDEPGDAQARPASKSARAPFALQFPPAYDALPESIERRGVECGLIVEIPSGQVLWARKSKEPVAIASMTKMMTVLLVLEEIERNPDITLDTVIPVSDAAYRIGGSQVWLDPRESFTMEELLISIMVKSANDSSYLVAEYAMDGDMDAFIARMNERAEELGMTDTHFINAHGLPDGNDSNLASCEDLALLANALLKYEVATRWASIARYTFRPEADQPTILDNHNRLVSTTDGVDGLKTGYTRRAGFCITASCLRENRRLVVVATGFKSSGRRNAFVDEAVDWAYQLD